MEMSLFKRLRNTSKPLYKGIADCIESGVDRGELKGGDRLLTHRALAKALGVSPVTVSQAYQVLEKQGLVESLVGSGTFISLGVDLSAAITEDSSAEVNLSIIKPIETPFLGEIKTLLRDGFERDLSSSFGYNSETSTQKHIAIARQWVGRRDIQFNDHGILICSGAQHALLVAILASTQANDCVAVEEYCYPGILAVLKHTQRIPVSIELNEYGMCPASLDAACRKQSIAAVVVVASCHNPTGLVMPNEQRRALANVAKNQGLTIIDDDIYGFLCYPEYKPLWTFLPEQTIYIDSLSKSIAPALRTAFIVIPNERRSEIMNLIRSTIWLCSPLLQTLSFELISSGKAKRIEAWQKAEVGKRQQVAASILPADSYNAYPFSPIIWLLLPEHWTSSAFARELIQQGVHVTEDFYFSEKKQSRCSYVRISLVGTKHISDLKHALTIINNTMNAQASLGGF